MWLQARLIRKIVKCSTSPNQHSNRKIIQTSLLDVVIKRFTNNDRKNVRKMDEKKEFSPYNVRIKLSESHKNIIKVQIVPVYLMTWRTRLDFKPEWPSDLHLGQILMGSLVFSWNEVQHTQLPETLMVITHKSDIIEIRPILNHF